MIPKKMQLGMYAKPSTYSYKCPYCVGTFSSAHSCWQGDNDGKLYDPFLTNTANQSNDVGTLVKTLNDLIDHVYGEDYRTLQEMIKRKADIDMLQLQIDELKKKKEILEGLKLQ